MSGEDPGAGMSATDRGKALLTIGTSRLLTAVGVLILLAFGGGAFLFFCKDLSDGSIAMLGGIGFVVILLCLAGLVIINRALQLTVADAALGLPKGSVRALLAFSLVVVFVIVVSWSLDAKHAVSRVT